MRSGERLLVRQVCYSLAMVTKRKDFTQIAFDVVRRATGETTAPAHSKKPESGRGVKSIAPKAPKAPKRAPLVKR